MTTNDEKEKVQIALEEFLTEIRPYTWIYEYEDGTVYKVSFGKGDLMHLLGLNKLSKFAMLISKKVDGVGSMCFNDLKKGKITDKKINKNKNKRLIQRKINNFTNLKNLLSDLETQHFYFDKNLVPCKIDAEYMLYNPIDDIHCHFGATESSKKQEQTPKACSPVTWFIEEDRPDMYIIKQKEADLKRITKIENKSGQIIFTKSAEEVTP